MQDMASSCRTSSTGVLHMHLLWNNQLCNFWQFFYIELICFVLHEESNSGLRCENLVVARYVIFNVV